MWLIFLVLVIIFLSLIAAIVAIVITVKNKNAWKAEPEVTVKATILGTYDETTSMSANLTGSGTVDSFNSYEMRKYFVEFMTENKSKKRFQIKKKEFLSMHDGDVGVLKYKGDKMLSFAKDYSASNGETSYDAPVQAQAQTEKKKFFFQKDTKAGKTVKFYADASGLGVSIPSNAPIDCDYEEICSFIDKIYDCESDNFFVLENENGVVLQFSNDGGGSKDIDVDIPDAEQKGSYQGQLNSLQDVKTLVGSYFNNVDIPFNYGLKMNKW